jgi:putative transposase
MASGRSRYVNARKVRNKRLGDACHWWAFSADNALAESIIGLFKTEVVRRYATFKTVADVEFALMEWVDWYNNARRHSRLDYHTPAEYETAYYAQNPPRRPALVNS